MIPLCLINQSRVVEVSKLVSLCVEAPPAFMDIQEREKGERGQENWKKIKKG